MGRQRSVRYAKIGSFPNFVRVGIAGTEPFGIDRAWDPSLFVNDQPITLELGCGKGEYTLNLARRFPKRNFIGIDNKSDRIYVGARRTARENLTNAVFVKIQIEHLIHFFPENIVSEAWIPFPDPHVGSIKGKRRLTSGRFLDIYRQLMKPSGTVHLKTDDPTLYHFSKKSIADNSARLLRATDDLYASEYLDDELRNIQTTYEKRYLSQSKTIKYINFSF